MNEYRSVLERAESNFAPLDLELESLLRRRDRKRRNQRIAAGVVGIAVFVAAVWIVTSVGSLDRSETSVVPGQDVTGPAETAQPPGPPYGEPDVEKWGECHPGAPPDEGIEVDLELWDLGDRIKVRFKLLDSPAGLPWRVVIGHTHIPAISPPEVVFRGTRVPEQHFLWSKRFVIVRKVTDLVGVDEFQAKAVSTQWDEFCRVNARI